MELRHLRALVAVAEELHFGRAAKRLHLSQPPVSLAIKELESEFGMRLFERTSRRIEITPAGEQVLRDARAVLARTDSMGVQARAIAKGQTGSLSIGFISTAAYSFLPRVLQRLRSDYPDVALTLHESTADRIEADVQAGALDVGCIWASPLLSSSLDYLPTGRDPLVVALPEHHALSRLARIPLERLAAEQFLCFERHYGPLMFDAVVSACMRHGFSPRIFTARQMHTIVSLVAGGMGVALVPKSVEVMRREGVVYLPLRGDRVVVETGVCWRKEDESPVVKEFIRHLRVLS